MNTSTSNTKKVTDLPTMQLLHKILIMKENITTNQQILQWLVENNNNKELVSASNGEVENWSSNKKGSWVNNNGVTSAWGERKTEVKRKYDLVDVGMSNKTSSTQPTCAGGLDSNQICFQVVDQRMPMNEVINTRNKVSGDLSQSQYFPVNED